MTAEIIPFNADMAERAPDERSPATRRVLTTAAAGTRDAMRRLRSLLVEIHPPNLRASGLEAALGDAASPLRAQGVEVVLDIEPDVELSDDDERLVYRAAAEALRNVERHARGLGNRVRPRPGSRG